MTHRLIRSCLVVPMLTLGSAAWSLDSNLRAVGEPSQSMPAEAATWSLAKLANVAVQRQEYATPSARQLKSLQLRKPLAKHQAWQVGFARIAADEARSSPTPVVWTPLPDGAAAMRFEAHSPGAAALRIGLSLRHMDDAVTLHIGGSDDPRAPIETIRVAEAKQRLGDDGLYWTPSTDGDTQIIEIRRDVGTPTDAATLRAVKLSHQVVNSRDAHQLLAKIGESGSCNVDVICRVNELGQNYVNTKNAVAHMRFVLSGGTYICTGTLLADQLIGSQVPYFHSANHCFSSNTSVAPNPTQMQTVANTLNTFWNYEATTCGGLTSQPQTQLSGGATYLYSSHVTDGMLLRLKDPAPAIAYFAGWNATAIPANADVFAIHHPSGDAKQVSDGKLVAIASNDYTAAWLTGTTEGGSSGSGLFTLSAEGAYELRGGLYGGFAACSNSGSVANTQNRDYYSRLDVDIAVMGQWINAPEIVFKDDFGP